MKKLLKNYIKKHLSGKSKYQNLFEYLYLLSIDGMNYGKGDFFDTSGELNALKYIKSKLSDNQNLVLFDVGGNIGDYSRMLHKVFNDKDFEIYTFEPAVKIFNILCDNLKGLNNITKNNLGLSDVEGKQTLYSLKDFSGMSSLYQRNLDYLNIKMNETEDIQLTTIDNYCLLHNIDTIHFLKLDIEGNELNTLNGAHNLINQNKIKYIQFEFGGTNIDSRTYFKDFWNLLHDKYNFYRVVKDGLVHIAAYREQFEIFTTINFLLELKD